MAVVSSRITLEQFMLLPEEKPALEFDHGVVTQKVLPKGPHGSLQAELVVRINNASRPRRRVRAFPEVRVFFAGVSYVPDVVVYLSERIPRRPDGRIADDLFDPPDAAMEIASPGQSVEGLTDRCILYVDNGVRVSILIVPADESLTVFRPNHSPEVLRGADRIDIDEILPGFQLTVDDLFDSLR